MSVRVRFAPSPTGALHIGGVRTALYNYLFAKKNSGIFILRIEDTDQGRFVPGAEAYIRESLKWCGIEPTEGIGYGGNHEPYRQSERKEIYMKHAIQLINSGKAYYAFDTETDLEDMRKRLADAGVPAPKYDASVRMTMKNSLTLTAEQVQEFKEQKLPYVIRLRVEPNQEVTFNDIVRGEVTFDSKELDDKILIKGDGMPTYHMANVIDDHLMEITHVIRGEEWLSSTAHHLLLYEAFNWHHPEFAHLPLLMKPDGKGKLSKRDGAKFGIPVFPLSWKGETLEDSFEGFREYGFEPEALINFLAFLGWNPGTDQEIFSLEELTDAFDLHKVHKSGARFDIEKALWFNQQYIRKMSPDLIKQKLLPILQLNGWVASQEKLDQIILLYQERVHTLKDILVQSEYLFKEPATIDQDAFKKHWKPALKDQIVAFCNELKDSKSFKAIDLEPEAKEKMKLHNLKPGEVFPIFRLCLCGSLQGPTVFQMLEILGEGGLNRILDAITASQ
ncbi:MAG: glutamate--tRNA ligase [Saprospiraceae bacterium]